jgi:uncharacterized membrane protein HdeD (DUF308 family)
MSDIITFIVAGIIAYATYAQSKKSREANNKAKATLWMIVSMIAGIVAIFSIFGLIA